jgi:2-polyprenyl-3-methyl-5-hydroxy-6-metoxy-1,4-benzoquinol methylase
MNPTAASQIVWNEETLTRFWTYYAQFPETYFSFQYGAAVLAKVRPRLRAGARVVDYGCGPGHLLTHLLNAGYVVSGADLSIETMAQASTKANGRPNFEGLFTVDQLIARGQSFDAVFLLEVIEHLDDHWLAETLANIRLLLARDGILFVTTPNEERLQEHIVYCPVSNLVFHRWQHVRSWSRDSLEASLREHGFGRIETEACNFTSAEEMRLPRLRRLAHWAAVRWRRPRSLLAMAQL